jgi:hypothetical protein
MHQVWWRFSPPPADSAPAQRRRLALLATPLTSPRRWLAVWATCAAVLIFLACGNAHAPRAGAGNAWTERVFLDESCSNEEIPAAPPLDTMALADTLRTAGERADRCLHPQDRGELLVVFGGAGCVRAMVLLRPVPPRVEKCLVHTYVATRIPPFREGVVRAGTSWADRR